MSSEDSEEKPQILHIKKDAVIDTECYYNREKRLLMQRSSPPRETKGLFHFILRLGGRGRRRGRGLTPLFPLFAVAIGVFLVFRIPAGRPTNSAVISGYQTTLRADPFQDAVFVSVSFTRSSSGAAETATAVFTLPDTGETLVVSDTLSGDMKILRGKMRYTGKEKRLDAEIEVGHESKTLVVTIKRPAPAPAVKPEANSTMEPDVKSGVKP